MAPLTQRVYAAVLASIFCWAQVGQAAPLPRVVVVPLGHGKGVSEKAASRLTALVAGELAARADEVALAEAGPPHLPPSARETPKPPDEAVSSIDFGKKALAELKFNEAIGLFNRGLDLLAASPASLDYKLYFGAHIQLAVACFRVGDDRGAQKALMAVARLEPTFKLASTYPPVFLREFEKAKKRLEKLPSGSLSIEGPVGSTAYVNGRALGVTPAIAESLHVGQHFIVVEGARGERYAESVDVRPGLGKVKALFSQPVITAPLASAAPAIPPVLDERALGQLSRHAQVTGADYALVGFVYAARDRQLGIASALYSASKQGVVVLSTRSCDPELLTAQIEAYRLADEAVKRIHSFGSPSALPVALHRTELGAERELGESKVSLVPNDGRAPVRAFDRPSVLVTEPVPLPAPPDVSQPRKGTSAWVWILAGIGVAALAGGTYYAVTQATAPATGTVTATW